ncbi:GNAT family N-acetyltransferase [Pseudomonas sp. PSKL.D1]|uniref:GNAT family N-acetyltransferase n=1 Tax=Pseudomonas sp. PSKL.D1 TaxID=3029060 RepID=UPI0023815D87|nr:GNAT family N-acetyltransferase [Pseudomonas sp. PSKL.D1]WDY56229.1 GNAT family N-acetyltransferase [Pseudomonas sp. PSKL.D1]
MVDPSARGVGIGRALLESAIAWSEGCGAQRIRLGVTITDSPAMHLYRACGIRPVGEPGPLREASSLESQVMELEI